MPLETNEGCRALWEHSWASAGRCCGTVPIIGPLEVVLALFYSWSVHAEKHNPQQKLLDAFAYTASHVRFDLRVVTINPSCIQSEKESFKLFIMKLNYEAYDGLEIDFEILGHGFIARCEKIFQMQEELRQSNQPCLPKDIAGALDKCNFKEKLKADTIQRMLTLRHQMMGNLSGAFQ